MVVSVSRGAADVSEEEDDEKTVPLGFMQMVASQLKAVATPSGAYDQTEDDEKTVPLGFVSAASQSKAVVTPPGGYDKMEEDDRTVAIIRHDIGIDPVVGWLVCTEGKEKGRDFRIHADNNFIGRSEKMDICVPWDDTISRENHAMISYDGLDRTYYFSPGDGRGIVRLNGMALFQTAQLKAYDEIIVGMTGFLFIPLCGEKFDWIGGKSVWR